MKKVICLLSVFCLLACIACENCSVKRPKNLKPIDWENYNDVYTVYWNCVKICNDPDNVQGKKVKVYGWCYCNGDGDYLSLIDVNNPNKPPKNCYDPYGSNASIIVHTNKLYTTENFFAKTVYVEGSISLPCLETIGCSHTSVDILADTIFINNDE